MSLLWGIVVVVVADAIAIAAILFVRRRAPEGSYFTDGDRASGVFGVLATGFAIFAGFVIFLAFTTYDDSRAGGEAEALVVVQQFETAQFLAAGYPGSTDRPARLLRALRRPRGVAADGGRRPRRRHQSLGGRALPDDPQSPTRRPCHEQTAFAKWLDQTSDREEARRDRVHGAAGITPTTVWIVLLLTAAIVFFYMLFFADSAEMKRSQAMLIGSGTTIVVVTLLAIHALDNPYRRGLGSIRPVAMERSLRILERGACGARRRSDDPVRRRRQRDDVVTDEARQRSSTRACGDAAARAGRDRDRVVDVPVVRLARQAGGGAERFDRGASRVDATGRSRQPPGAGRRRALHAVDRRLRAERRASSRRSIADASAQEFEPAFDAWIATRPRENPNAPLSPFAMPQYRLAASTQADALESQAGEFSQASSS